MQSHQNSAGNIARRGKTTQKHTSQEKFWNNSTVIDRAREMAKTAKREIVGRNEIANNT